LSSITFFIKLKLSLTPFKLIIVTIGKMMSWISSQISFLKNEKILPLGK